MIELLEEEEEEWPDTGAQNPEEAQQYIDKINNIFDHLSELIHEDKKNALGMTIRNFKKWVMKQWVDDGGCGRQRCSPHHKGPRRSLPLTTPHQGRSRRLQPSR